MNPSSGIAPARPLLSAPLLIVLVLIPAAGCRRADRDRLGAAAEHPALVHAPQRAPLQAPRPPAARHDDGPAEIFHDLTHYDWYRKGEPLLLDGRAFQPDGRPQPTMGRSFRALGRFQGVAYYAPEPAEPPYTIVYVPVSRGYWQAFSTDLPPQSADGPDAPPE